MAVPPRKTALVRADEVFGLPAGMTALWLTQGRVRRVYLQDHGDMVVGVMREDMLHEIARCRAASIRTARTTSRTSATPEG